MDNLKARFFLMGWFDPLEKRLAYMAAYDSAIKGSPVTYRVTTMKHEHWGLV